MFPGMAAPPRFTGFRTPVGAWSIHALGAGPAQAVAPPVVLVHGYGVAGRYWLPLARRLAARFPVYVPDLPGHGRSSTPSRALDVPELVGALGGWMAAAGVGPAVVVGNSLGCQVAAELAARDPARVAALVLGGPTVDPRARSAARQLVRLLLSAPAEHPGIYPIILGDYLRVGVARLLAELGHMLRHRIEEVLPSVAAPTLVLRGTLDRVAPRRWADEAAALLPRGTVAEVPFAGHAAHYTRPDAVADRIVRFVGSRPTTPGSPPPPDGLPPAPTARAPGAPG
jgi:pimeloyl-ACP methyl ester carboxylesterase